MKFVSSEVVNDCFVRVNAILNLSAPAAFSFDVPVALSNNDCPNVVSPESMNDSTIERPTL